MSEPMFWSGSFEGKPRKSHGAVLFGAGALLAVAALALGVLFPPAASPLDLSAYWSQFAFRVVWQGLIAVTLVVAALLAGAMKASRTRERTLAIVGLCAVWLIASLPPPMLQRQAANDTRASLAQIAARYRAAAVRSKNDLFARYSVIGAGYIASPFAIERDPDLTQADAKLAAARQLVADYRRQWRAAQDGERAEVARTDRAALPALDARIAADRAAEQTFAPAEDGYFDAIAASIAHLRSVKPGWWREGPLVVFASSVFPVIDRESSALGERQHALAVLEEPTAKDPFSAALPIWN